MECKACGGELRRRQAFCPECGELTRRGASFASQVVETTAAGAESASNLFDGFVDYVKREENRKAVLVGGAALALVLVALTNNPISNGVLALFQDEPIAPQLTSEGLPDFDGFEDVFLSDEAEYYVAGIANVRDFPTSLGTNVTRTFNGGEVVMAREVMAFDPSSRWYKLSDGGYVWGRNLESFDEVTNEAGPVFPSQFVGSWSSMDTCRGADMNTEIRITPTEIQFYESTGTLVAVTEDSRGKPIHELAMVGEGSRWTSRLSLMVTADRSSILLDNVDDPQRGWTYYNPEAGCAHVSFDN